MKTFKKKPFNKKKTKYLHFIAHCLFVLAKGSFCLTKFLLLLTKMQPGQQQVALKKKKKFLFFKNSQKNTDAVVASTMTTLQQYVCGCNFFVF